MKEWSVLNKSISTEVTAYVKETAAKQDIDIYLKKCKEIYNRKIEKLKNNAQIEITEHGKALGLRYN